MGLEKDTQINELYYLKHKHDTFKHRHYNWEDNLLRKTTSSYIWKNPVMNKYLTHIQSILVLMVEKVSVQRNFFNFTVNKYNNDHWG
jgi:hypothetical protein